MAVRCDGGHLDEASRRVGIGQGEHAYGQTAAPLPSGVSRK